MSATAAHDAPPAVRSARRAARAGITAILPLAAGYVPFALVVGATAAEHGAGLAGWAGSWLIYGGSAQLTAVQLFDRSGAVVAIATALVVNARLLVYSASLRPAWRDQPRWFRALGAALVIDPTWALSAPRQERGAEQRAFFLAAGAVLGVVWSTSIAAGMVLGPRLQVDSLRIVAPVCVAALVAPRLAVRGERLPVVAAAAVALVGRSWPAGTGQLAAIAAGVLAGELGDRGRR